MLLGPAASRGPAGPAAGDVEEEGPAGRHVNRVAARQGTCGSTSVTGVRAPDLDVEAKEGAEATCVSAATPRTGPRPSPGSIEFS